MAFTPEDGTGVAGANAYITAQEWIAHHTDRGVASATDGTYSTTEIEASIVKATDYMDKRFVLQYKGDKATSAQGLEWPRNSAIDDDGRTMTERPDALMKAAAEYAYLALTLGTDLAPVGTGAAGKITEEKVGPITTKYGAGTVPMTSTGNSIQDLPEYPAADLWVEQLLEDSTSRRLIRG